MADNNDHGDGLIEQVGAHTWNCSTAGQSVRRHTAYGSLDEPA